MKPGEWLSKKKWKKREADKSWIFYFYSTFDRPKRLQHSIRSFVVVWETWDDDDDEELNGTYTQVWTSCVI